MIKKELEFTECILYIRHHAKHLKYITTMSCINIPNKNRKKKKRKKKEDEV